MREETKTCACGETNGSGAEIQLNPEQASDQERLTVRSAEVRKRLVNRLNRIEGQIRGLRQMIENDAYCNDVLIQSAAAGAALNAFNRELIGTHMRGCVARDLREGREEVVDELLLTLAKLMK